MNIVGQKVKLFLINSLSAEGVVHSWNDSQAVIVSNQKQLIVNNPNTNIIMYYVFDNNITLKESIPQDKLLQKEPELISEPKVEEQEENLIELNSSLRLKKIADLKIMAAKAQREQIRKQLTTFHSINTDQILGKYGTPSFINSQYGSSQEIDNGDAVNSGGVPKVPGQTSE